MHFSVVIMLCTCAAAVAQISICPDQWEYVEQAQHCYRVSRQETIYVTDRSDCARVFRVERRSEDLLGMERYAAQRI